MVVLDYAGNAQCKSACLPEECSKVELDASKKLCNRNSLVSSAMQAQQACQKTKYCDRLKCPPDCKVICARYVQQIKEQSPCRLKADLTKVTAQIPQNTIGAMYHK